MSVLGGDLRRIAVLDTSLRVNADQNLVDALLCRKNWRQLPAELGNTCKAGARNWAYIRVIC